MYITAKNGEEFASFNGGRLWEQIDNRKISTQNEDFPQLELYPNPVMNSALIKFKLAENSENVSIRIISTQGSQMELWKGKLSKGNCAIQLNFNNFTEGTHFVRVITNNQVFDVKCNIIR